MVGQISAVFCFGHVALFGTFHLAEYNVILDELVVRHDKVEREESPAPLLRLFELRNVQLCDVALAQAFRANVLVMMECKHELDCISERKNDLRRMPDVRLCYCIDKWLLRFAYGFEAERVPNVLNIKPRILRKDSRSLCL